MTMTDAASDREQIVGHIHGLFQAYMRGDRDTIRRGHTADWRGFPVRARRLIRGLDEYMVEADTILATMRSVGYRLIDVEIDLHGDVAIVYYLAECTLQSADSSATHDIAIRSVDVYRREPSGWNQCGSNICVVPDPPSVTVTPSRPELSTAERANLLSCRERVWRAWFCGDVAALEALLPEQVIAIDPGVEAWADRGGVLARSRAFADAGNRLISLEFPQTAMQVLGDAVVLYTTFRVVTELAGKRTERVGRGTETFIRRGDRWLNSGWHLERER